MSGFLLDTNVLSELRKDSLADRNVTNWMKYVPDTDLFFSVLALGEIRKGIERARPSDPRKALTLERWLNGLKVTFARRILPISEEIAQEWGRIAGRRPLSPIDALLAATALVHNHTLVTRNIRDIHDTGVKFLNPFDA